MRCHNHYYTVNCLIKTKCLSLTCTALNYFVTSYYLLLGIMLVGLLKLEYFKYIFGSSYKKGYNSDHRKEGKISVFGIL